MAEPLGQLGLESVVGQRLVQSQPLPQQRAHPAVGSSLEAQVADAPRAVDRRLEVQGRRVEASGVHLVPAHLVARARDDRVVARGVADRARLLGARELLLTAPEVRESARGAQQEPRAAGPDDEAFGPDDAQRQLHLALEVARAVLVVERAVEVGERARGLRAREEVAADVRGGLALDGVGRAPRLAFARLERRPERGVVLAREQLGEPLVHRLAHRRLIESAAHAHRPQQPLLPLEAADALQHGDALEPEHLADEQGIEVVARAGRDVEQVALLLREPREALAHEVADRGRDLDPADRLGADPGPLARAYEPPRLAQRAQHLEDEERVPVRLRADAEPDLVGDVGGAERLGQERREHLGREPRQPQPLDRGPVGEARHERLGNLGPERADQQHPMPARGRGQRGEQGAALVGGAMEVFDHDDGRRLARRATRRTRRTPRGWRRASRTLPRRETARRGRAPTSAGASSGVAARRRRIADSSSIPARCSRIASASAPEAPPPAWDPTNTKGASIPAAHRASQASTSRDLPMPASPSTSTTEPAPPFAAS